MNKDQEILKEDGATKVKVNIDTSEVSFARNGYQWTTIRLTPQMTRLTLEALIEMVLVGTSGMSEQKAEIIRDLILSDICNRLPDDPENDRTVCINYEALCEIISEHLGLAEEE